MRRTLSLTSSDSRRSAPREKPKLANINEKNIDGIRDVLRNLIALEDEERRATRAKEVKAAKDATRDMADWIANYKREQKEKEEARQAAKEAKEAAKYSPPPPTTREEEESSESGVESGTEETSSAQDSFADALRYNEQNIDANIALAKQFPSEDGVRICLILQPVDVVANTVRMSKKTVRVQLAFSAKPVSCTAQPFVFKKTSVQNSAISSFIKHSRATAKADVRFSAKPKSSSAQPFVMKRKSVQKEAISSFIKHSHATTKADVRLSKPAMKPETARLVLKPAPIPAKCNVKASFVLAAKPKPKLNPTATAPTSAQVNVARSEPVKKTPIPAEQVQEDLSVDLKSIKFLPQRPPLFDMTSKVDSPERTGLRARLHNLRPAIFRRQDKPDRRRQTEEEYREAMLRLKHPERYLQEATPPVQIPRILVPLKTQDAEKKKDNTPPPVEPFKEDKVPEEETPKEETPNHRDEEDRVVVTHFGRHLPKPRFIMRLGTPKRCSPRRSPARGSAEPARFLHRRAPPEPQIRLSEAAFTASLPAIRIARPTTFLARLEAHASRRPSAGASEERKALTEKRVSLRSVSRQRSSETSPPPAPPPPEALSVKLKSPTAEHRSRAKARPVPKRCQEAAFVPRWRRLDALAAAAEHDI